VGRGTFYLFGFIRIGYELTSEYPGQGNARTRSIRDIQIRKTGKAGHTVLPLGKGNYRKKETNRSRRQDLS
jgi:hypothetical protein